MSYIKNGIVTRIELDKNTKDNIEFLKNNFNLDFFTKTNKIYLTKNQIITQNIKNYRDELMELTTGKGDSLNDCEAYYLETKIEKIIEKEIYLTKDNKKYYFKDYENTKFETDICIYKDKKILIKIYFIPIFWDTNYITSENFNTITNTVNNLTRKTMKNILKDISWFTII